MLTKLTKGVIGDLKLLRAHQKEHGMKRTLALMHSKDAPGLIHFVKYGICGIAAVTVQTLVFMALTLPDVFPAHDQMWVDGEWIENPAGLPIREKHSIVANLLAFPAANLAAYFTNLLWVFTPGRHSKAKEFWMFTGIAFFATVVALFGGPFLIHQGLPAWVAQIGFIVTSALVNFVLFAFLLLEMLINPALIPFQAFLPLPRRFS